MYPTWKQTARFEWVHPGDKVDFLPHIRHKSEERRIKSPKCLALINQKNLEWGLCLI